MELLLWLSVWNTASIVDVETSDRVRAIKDLTACKEIGDHLPIFDSSELSDLIGEIACYQILLNCDIKYAFCLKDNWILTLVTLCTVLSYMMHAYFIFLHILHLYLYHFIIYYEYEINILLLLSTTDSLANSVTKFVISKRLVLVYRYGG